MKNYTIEKLNTINGPKFFILQKDARKSTVTLKGGSLAVFDELDRARYVKEQLEACREM